MRIFFPNAAIKYPPSDGCDIHRYQLVKNLVELGHEVHTLYPDENPFTIKHSQRRWRAMWQLPAAHAIYCRIQVNPDRATAWTLPRTRWLIPRRTIVAWEFNVSLEYPLSWRRSLEEIEESIRLLRESAPRVDLAICVTRRLADEARKLLGIHNTYVLQNGSDPEMFRPDLSAPPGLALRPGRLNVAFIASGPNVYHDTTTICDAAAIISREDLPIDIHVVGASEALFPAHRPPCLHHHGRVSHLDLPNYLAAMDVGLVLYRMTADGLSPLKLFDYLASGCVPICSESQPMHEVLDGTGAGLIGDWNGTSLVQALVQLHNDRARMARMSACGRSLVQQVHNWRRVAERTVQAINEARALRDRQHTCGASAQISDQAA